MRPQDFTFQVTCKHCSHTLHTPHFGFTCPLNLCIFCLTGSHGGLPFTQSHSGSTSDMSGSARSNLSDCLDKEVLFYRENTFAASTNKTYLAQRAAYFDFCVKMGISPIPLSQEDLGRYIAFLSRRLTFSSVRQYLNAVRLLHLDAGLANPIENNWYVPN